VSRKKLYCSLGNTALSRSEITTVVGRIHDDAAVENARSGLDQVPVEPCGLIQKRCVEFLTLSISQSSLPPTPCDVLTLMIRSFAP
jgi:hypothetical protein